MSGWAQFGAILRKDLIRELRTRDMIVLAPTAIMASRHEAGNDERLR